MRYKLYPEGNVPCTLAELTLKDKECVAYLEEAHCKASKCFSHWDKACCLLQDMLSHFLASVVGLP